MAFVHIQEYYTISAVFFNIKGDWGTGKRRMKKKSKTGSKSKLEIRSVSCFFLPSVPRPCMGYFSILSVGDRDCYT
jgi:hypothetical protein